MKEKQALLLGATQGIGAEVARQLAQAGYRVWIVGRNPQAGQALARELAGTFLRADLSLLSDTRRVAEEVREQTEHIDVIVHTADVLALQRDETAEGHERSFATNYLSRFLLNGLLRDVLERADRPRIIHVAAANMPVALTEENFPVPTTASSFTGHNVGQAANDYYGLQFAERYPQIQINILNPGLVDTSIRRRGKGGPLVRALVAVMEVLMRPLTQAPANYARLVSAIATGQHPAAATSVLIDRKGRAMPPRPDRLDPARQAAVWAHSERLTGLIQEDSFTN